MEDQCALPSRKEAGDPVDHVGGYIFGEQEGPKLGRVDVVEASLYVEEEGGHLQEGPLEGVDLVSEGGYCIRGTEAREGATLVRVKQACFPCQGGESDGKDAFEDLGDGFKEDDNAKGGRSVVGRFAGFVEDNPVRVFEAGGVVPKGHQWGQEVEEEAGIEGVHLFPDRVRYSVGAWCRRGGGLG